MESLVIDIPSDGAGPISSCETVPSMAPTCFKAESHALVRLPLQLRYIHLDTISSETRDQGWISTCSRSLCRTGLERKKNLNFTKSISYSKVNTVEIRCFIVEYIDWRYSQSCWYFRPALWTIAPLTLFLVSSSPPPSPFPVWISIL